MQSELARLKHLQNELASYLRQIPIDEPSEHTAADKLGGQAIAQVDQEADKVRTQCELAEEQPPAESEKSRKERLHDAINELDALIGLDSVKREVRLSMKPTASSRPRARILLGMRPYKRCSNGWRTTAAFPSHSSAATSFAKSATSGLRPSGERWWVELATWQTNDKCCLIPTFSCFSISRTVKITAVPTDLDDNPGPLSPA